MAKVQYRKTDKKFYNPYHFVPLDEARGCARDIDVTERLKSDELMSGYIECRLTTLTPLFIPDTQRQSEVQKEGVSIKSHNFFSYGDGKPVIPGSSLRGTIRSVFEAVTRSCLGGGDVEKQLYKRTTSVGKPGRLFFDESQKQWKIQPCTKYMLPSYLKKGLKDRQEIRFKAGNHYKNRKYMPKEVEEINCSDCDKKGWYHQGEAFQRKHHESIFELKKNDDSIPVDADTVRNLLENYRLYQDETVNQALKDRHHGYRSNLPDAEHKGSNDLNGMLIYYVERNGRYYLSPAAIGREIFYNTIKDLVGDENEKKGFEPCIDSGSLCPACALFGFVSKKDALKSRVSFDDALPEGEVPLLDPVILPELASPKLSATEFYLKKQSEKHHLWNYDYAGWWEKQGFHTDKNYEAKLQGRKFYWHHKEMKTFESENRRLPKDRKIEYSDRLVQVRPVDKNAKFRFRVYFDRITERELRQLHWALSLGGKEHLAHKMGMGKPVGLGSVKIEVDSVNIRKIALHEGLLEYDWQTKEIEIDETVLDTSEHVLKALKRIMDFENMPSSVEYPYCIDMEEKRYPEHYRWFVANRQCDGKGNGTKPIISQYLHDLNSEDSALKIIQISSGSTEKSGKSSEGRTDVKKRQYASPPSTSSKQKALAQRTNRKKLVKTGQISTIDKEKKVGQIGGKHKFDYSLYFQTYGSDRGPKVGESVKFSSKKQPGDEWWVEEFYK